VTISGLHAAASQSGYKRGRATRKDRTLICDRASSLPLLVSAGEIKLIYKNMSFTRFALCFLEWLAESLTLCAQT